MGSWGRTRTMAHLERSHPVRERELHLASLNAHMTSTSPRFTSTITLPLTSPHLTTPHMHLHIQHSTIEFPDDSPPNPQVLTVWMSTRPTSASTAQRATAAFSTPRRWRRRWSSASAGSRAPATPIRTHGGATCGFRAHRPRRRHPPRRVKRMVRVVGPISIARHVVQFHSARRIRVQHAAVEL